MAMTSTARLIENTKRLAGSIGSHGSLAPVSAQPPTVSAAARDATARTLRTAWTMDAKNSQKRLCFAAVAASVAHGACTLKAHHRDRPFFFLCKHKYVFIFTSWTG